MVQCHPPLELEELPKEDEERLEILFSKIDTDGNGKIDIHDLSAALKELAPHINRSYAEKFLAKTGKNAGDVTLSEFIHYVREHEKNLKLQFSHLDKNKDGKVDLEELISAFADLGIAIGRNEATNLLKRMDQDGSLNISYDEWRDYLLLAPATDIHALIHFWRHSTVRSTLSHMKTFGEITYYFFMSFHLIHFKNKSEHSMRIFTYMNKISHYFSIYMLTTSLGITFVFGLPSLYMNKKKGAFTNISAVEDVEYSIIYAIPGVELDNYFISVTIFNIWMAYCCVIAACLTDLLLALVVLQIIGHIKLLSCNMLNLPKPKNQTAIKPSVSKDDPFPVCELYDDEENENIRKQIGEFVEYHLFIVRFTDRVSGFFGALLGLNYAFHLVSCCMLLLQCTQGDPYLIIRFGLVLLAVFGQLIHTSVMFEIINTVSLQLKHSVYAMPWESMSLSNQRAVSIILMRMQIPINVTAMGMTPVGVQTMAAIMKTTLSYFAFLRSIGE